MKVEINYNKKTGKYMWMPVGGGEGIGQRRNQYRNKKSWEYENGNTTYQTYGLKWKCSKRGDYHDKYLN